MWWLLVVFYITQTAQCSCPAGFELAETGQCRGLVDATIFAHDTAYEKTVATCAEIQGLPVIIHSDEQQQYWLTRQQQQTWSLIIGLTCNAKSKKWEWADSSAMDYLPPLANDAVLNGECSSGCSVYLWSDGKWRVFCDKAVDNVSIFCTTQLPAIPTPAGDGCQSFEDDAEDGICYQIYAKDEGWQDAQTLCRNVGAELASIHNLQENSFVRRLAVSKGAVTGLFLGGVIPANGNEFIWTDGTKWDYDNFQTGFPDNSRGKCLVMDTRDGNGQWVNSDCSTRQAVACVRKQNFPTPACSSATHKQEGEVLYSPGFPFDASVPCDYTIMVPAGKRVQLEIIMLEANTCCDSLRLYNDDGKTIASYTGEVHDQLSPISKSNLMKVSWKPNGGVNVRGLVMTFHAV